MGKIFYIMGKSASGKDKIYSILMEKKELKLHKLVLYTTRPIRAGEENGKQYFFTDDKKLEQFRKSGKLIESRSYDTIHGVWTYFTADDGQVDLEKADYLGIGTLESYCRMKEYYGKDKVLPIYIQVEDGERLQRALIREKKQDNPKYAEMCRRFLADQEDFSEEHIREAGIEIRFVNDDLDNCVRNIIKYINSVT
ncbi:MAG TPA: guanylate kinase [Candidatus Blautia intestinipullorum]|nr:guanylate kinase [Candidatus Blautia intestinipullorum]